MSYFVLPGLELQIFWVDYDVWVFILMFFNFFDPFCLFERRVYGILLFQRLTRTGVIILACQVLLAFDGNFAVGQQVRAPESVVEAARIRYRLLDLTFAERWQEALVIAIYL